MNDIREKLIAATRPHLLESVATAIHSFTIMARDSDRDDHRAKINNCIHYLAGRMIGLCNPSREATDHDLDDIADQFSLLYPSLRQRAVERLQG